MKLPEVGRKQTEALINVMLDTGAGIGGRDDASMDLYEADDECARRALPPGG
ncbi:hypothetical protein [Streptomyces sp. NRRL S-87]|uniref:hypothetical protein n=1 Tax=Streptomyces sp. NRRL S-87 TaxID=1463920 RepID=UPI00131AB7FD|nr:hypothetical protein [Streptomyces sp. NRRL S-87]